MPDFLLELGTEEIPAGYLDRAAPALAEAVQRRLTELGLPARELKHAMTPRRLAVWAGGLPARQPDREEEKSGPRQDAPAATVEKFAQSMGLTPADLEVREVTKGKKSASYYFAKRSIPGRAALEVLAEEIPAWIEGIPFPKSMRWVPGSRCRFARPLRRITALLDGEVVPTRWADVESGRQVEGHRFLAPGAIELKDADWGHYLEALRGAKVLADPSYRRRVIEEALAEHLGGAAAGRQAELVAEVANLVEWPLVDLGAFDERFLQLPPLVVREAMMDHQRYFPIERGGQLQARFAYVANRPFDAVIRRGNERVLRARLEDALFFFNLDRRRPLAERVQQLGEIVFMQELGSYQARIARIEALSQAVARAAGWLGADSDPLAGRLQLAARLARTDLTTEVVQEFPGLQGEMGAIYARLQGEEEEVCQAIREAYLPRGEGDALPESRVGIALSVADKLDTIVCAYATGRGPTGSKDPFMVRRSVLGVLRILRERGLDAGTADLLRAAWEQLPAELRQPEVLEQAKRYVEERLRVLGREGYHHQLVEAALPAGRDPSNVVDFWARLEALQTLARDPRFPRLCELVERSFKITFKNGPEVDPEDVDAARLSHPAEKALHQALQACRAPVQDAIAARDYVRAGQRYVDALAEVTHTFFEPAPTGVFVMDEDARLRTNRLALLKQVHGLLAAGFADLSRVDAAALRQG